MPLRILQIDTERGWRGGQRQTLLLSLALRQLGHHCVVVARAGEALALRAQTAGLAVIPVAPWFEFAPFAAARVRRVIREGRIDIVHAQASHALTLGAMAIRGTNARLVVTRHLARPPRDNAATRWKYRQVAASIAVSKAAAETMGNSGLDVGRIAVIPGGVETGRERRPASGQVLASLGVRAGGAEDPLLAIFIGALVDQKDPVTFVRAMRVVRAAIPTAQALMVGDGHLRADVQRAIEQEHLTETVHLAGFRDDVDDLLSAARVLVMSSRFEGLPLVVMDAFVLGVPVVATAGSGIPEAVQDGVTGLLTPVGDAGLLGAAVARVLTDSPLAARLAAAGKTHASDYSIDRTAALTLDVYSQALRKGGGSSDRRNGPPNG